MLFVPIRYINNGEPLDQVTLNRYGFDVQENLEEIIARLDGSGGGTGSVAEIPNTLALRDDNGTTQFAAPVVGTNPLRLMDASVTPSPGRVVMWDSNGQINFGGGGGGANSPVFSSEIAGMVAFFAYATVPAGWLRADGRAVSRTTYAGLFSVIGTTYGNGDGSTTFNLPDMRDSFPRAHHYGLNGNTRAFGSFQDFAIENITGYFGGDDRLQQNPHGGCFTTEKHGGGNGSSGGGTPGRVYFDASLSVKTANETRPRNVSLQACIKY